MSRPLRRSAASCAPTLLRRLLLWGIPALLLLGLVGIFVAKAAIESYLRSDGFRQFVTRKAGDTLNAECEAAPLHFSGMSVFSNGFKAHGNADAAFSALQLDQLRAQISLRRFFEKVWQVEEVEVQRVTLHVEGPRVESSRRQISPPDAHALQERGSSSSGWLPRRVEVGSSIIREANVIWSAGSMRGVALNLTQAEGGWTIAGQGGKIEQAGLPALEVRALKLLYREPSLFINSAELRPNAGGVVTATGEVNFHERLDVQLALSGVPLTPFLSEDWRLRFKGNVSGEVNAGSPLPIKPATRPQIFGALRLSEGELTALPFLDEIALFTRTQQFRRLNLTKASADFRHDGATLRVTNFVAESDGLIRIEGSFVVENAMMDGTFQVGVTPSSLQWLPGSQVKVFTETRGGYVWAPMRLTGPVNKPTEDLTPRLVAAAQGAIIEGVQGAVEQTIKSGREAAKSALDLLMPAGK